jgi:hypothetical protein
VRAAGPGLPGGVAVTRRAVFLGLYLGAALWLGCFMGILWGRV